MVNAVDIFRQTAAVLGLALVLVPVCGAQGYQFFSRSADIGENNVWVVNEFSEGPNILDMHVRRFANGSWTRLVPGGNANTNAGSLTWGVPVYAPADGVIKTCWRNFDDNPNPPEKLKRVTGDDNTTRRIFTAGNHVNIETPDGKIILLAHLQKGSVPANLCPFNAEEADVSKASGADYPTASIIPVGQRPQVKKGQFVGLAGNSGNSSGPHVHIHVAPVETDTSQGPTTAIPWVQAWAHPYVSNQDAVATTWYKLDNVAITSATGPTMLKPSPFLRRASEDDGQVFSAEPAYVSSNRAVTALQDHLGQFRLISWDFTGTSDIVRKHEVIEGQATNVKVVAHDSSHVVAALRDSLGNTKVILYHVGITGTFTRLDDEVADKAVSLDLTVTGGADKKIVVAVRRDDNKLKILVYDVDFSTSPARLQLKSSRLEQGTVSALAVTRGGNFTGAAVAVRTAENTLKVIPYVLTNSGATITRGADFEAGTVTTVLDVAHLPQGLATAMKDGAGILRLITLETNSAGNIVAQRDVATVNDAISEVRVTRTPHAANGNLVTAIRDSDGNLRLLAWTATSKGESLRRSGTSIAGAASRIATASRYYSVAGQSPRDLLLTVVRDSSNNLKLIEWESNLNP